MTRGLPVAIRLDRDGTINVKAPEDRYVTAPEELVLLESAARAIQALNGARIPVAVVTNQRGVALGRMTEADLIAVHERLEALLAGQGARIDACFHCPHQDRHLRVPQPLPGLLERARDRLVCPRLRNR